ncbi:MAG TPA: hypothetical protein DFS52_12370 [Myxococcales bacterium]|nr:hypothetical protein [Myxococcales bacterium]
MLVAFWQSTERNCEGMLPLLARIEDDYEPERFALVAVNLDNPEARDAAVKSFLQGKKRPNNLVLAGKQPMEGWELTKGPTLNLLGADRRIVAGHVGQVSEGTPAAGHRRGDGGALAMVRRRKAAFSSSRAIPCAGKTGRSVWGRSLARFGGDGLKGARSLDRATGRALPLPDRPAKLDRTRGTPWVGSRGSSSV